MKNSHSLITISLMILLLELCILKNGIAGCTCNTTTTYTVTTSDNASNIFPSTTRSSESVCVQSGVVITINGNYTFHGCTFYMENGSSIFVKGGYTLTMDIGTIVTHAGSGLNGLCSVWNGIEVAASAAIVFADSYIYYAGANGAIYFDNGATTASSIITSSTFDKNYVGIAINWTSGGNFDVYISDNIIECSSATIGISPYSSNRPLAGIQVQECDLTTSYFGAYGPIQYNNFTNMDYGIQFTKSGGTICWNSFNDIDLAVDLENFPTPASGLSVDVKNNTFAYLSSIGDAIFILGDYDVTNVFENTIYAVDHTAIAIHENHAGAIDVASNVVRDYIYGLLLKDNDVSSTQNILVHDNEFYFDAVLSDNTGIYIEESATGNNRNVEVHDNTIGSSGYPVHNGINLIEIESALVGANTIYFRNPTGGGCGISLNAGNTDQVYDNTITGSSSSYNFGNYCTGIFVSNHPDLIANGNTVSYSYFGFYGEYDLLGDNYNCNHLDHCYYGFAYAYVTNGHYPGPVVDVNYSAINHHPSDNKWTNMVSNDLHCLYTGSQVVNGANISWYYTPTAGCNYNNPYGTPSELVPTHGHDGSSVDITPISDCQCCSPCNPQLYHNKMDGSKEVVQNFIYPNPASDVATLSYDLENVSSGQLKIFNVLGEQLLLYNLDIHSNSIKFSLHNLINGFYLYEIYGDNKPIRKSSLVILK